MIEVGFNNEMEFEVPIAQIERVIRQIVADHGYASAEISLAVVDDPTMHKLNRDHLQHDYPTDVLSFILEDEQHLEGEVIVSADTAAAVAPEFGWTAESEMILYFIHGCLHLVGYDDHEATDKQKMREQETHYLQLLELQPSEGHPARNLRGDSR